jgi:hypothetical protein
MAREDVLKERIALVERTGNRLVELVLGRFPLVISDTAPEYRRALNGLVARTTGTMQAALHVAQLRREADLWPLIRSLFDHTTVLAWLAANPAANYPLWKAEDARNRIKAHDGWVRDLRRELLTPAGLAELRPIAAESHPGPTDLLSQARAADQYWRPRLGLVEDHTTFVGIYQAIYRSSSTRTHSTLQGLNDVVSRTPDHLVVMLESTTGEQAVASRAVVIYALALNVSSVANGYPRRADIEAATAEYMGA